MQVGPTSTELDRSRSHVGRFRPNAVAHVQAVCWGVRPLFEGAGARGDAWGGARLAGHLDRDGRCPRACRFGSPMRRSAAHATASASLLLALASLESLQRLRPPTRVVVLVGRLPGRGGAPQRWGLTGARWLTPRWPRSPPAPAISHLPPPATRAHALPGRALVSAGGVSLLSSDRIGQSDCSPLRKGGIHPQREVRSSGGDPLGDWRGGGSPGPNSAVVAVSRLSSLVWAAGIGCLPGLAWPAPILVQP